MAWCESNRIDYVLGLARNDRLVERIAIDLAWAEQDSLASGQPARRFAEFRWTTLNSWSRRRRVIAKADWLAVRGERVGNPRFIVTSLKASEIGARELYEDVYCQRGEMENRLKECQGDLFADRTSARSMRANQLWLASMAYVLLAAIRTHRPAAHPVRAGHLRHHPPQVAQDRRPGHNLCAAHQDRHGIGPSMAE